MLQVDNLEVVYNQAVMAIQGISLQVPQGGIIAVLGTNGAGKTTLLRALSGFLPSEYAEVTDGKVLFFDDDITNQSPHLISRKGIVLVPERVKTFPTLTTAEHLAMASSTAHDVKFSPEMMYEYFPVLRERAQQTAGYLSGGERQMLTIATALLCQPRVLLIDELSMGLSHLVVKQLAKVLVDLRDEVGLSILLVEQNAEIALSMADYAYIMETGRIVYDGDRDKLLQHDDVKEFYLGRQDGRHKSYKDVKQYRRTRRWWG